MPLLNLSEASCYYRFDGAAERPVVVLSHSLGLDHGMWDAQTADLLPYFRVLRYDTRGHGASSAPPGDYSIAELGSDVLAIADACDVRALRLLRPVARRNDRAMARGPCTRSG